MLSIGVVEGDVHDRKRRKMAVAIANGSSYRRRRIRTLYSA